MPAYVTLPGTSGNYFSTSDINLLDADTAHAEQSDGEWALGTGGSSLDQSTDVTPAFGTYTLKVVSSGSGLNSLQTANEAIPVTASTEHTFSCSVRAATASRYLRAALTFYDSGGSSLSSSNSDWLALADSMQTFSHTFTTPASTASMKVQFRYTEDEGNTFAGTTGEAYYIDAFCLRAGTSTVFVPSLRIVNDLELEWKAALDDYTPAVTNTILDCLNSNDGYRVRHTTGDLIEIAYGNGSSTRAQTSSATGLTDAETHVFKVTVDQSTGAVVYYVDGIQHDTDTMTTGAGSININDLVIGANAAASANWTDGDLYYVIVRDGIDGPVVARFDADDWVGV